MAVFQKCQQWIGDSIRKGDTRTGWNWVWLEPLSLFFFSLSLPLFLAGSLARFWLFSSQPFTNRHTHTGPIRYSFSYFHDFLWNLIFRSHFHRFQTHSFHLSLSISLPPSYTVTARWLIYEHIHTHSLELRDYFYKFLSHKHTSKYITHKHLFFYEKA